LKDDRVEDIPVDDVSPAVPSFVCATRTGINKVDNAVLHAGNSGRDLREVCSGHERGAKGGAVGKRQSRLLMQLLKPSVPRLLTSGAARRNDSA
jgi:hypothetical protein